MIGVSFGSTVLLCSIYTTSPPHFFFFFFNDTATTEIYTLSLHDALPISRAVKAHSIRGTRRAPGPSAVDSFLYLPAMVLDRKSTRLNSSHSQISYAVFCLKKKKKHVTRMLEREVNDVL